MMNWKIIFRPTILMAYGVAGLMVLITACSREEPANNAASENTVQNGVDGPGRFATPGEAIQAMADLIGSGDAGRTEEIFGSGSAELFSSGDPVADRRDADLVKSMILENVTFEEYDETTQIALIGDQAWPFPLPLVRNSDGSFWQFDTEAGKEELLNRRIGKNELSTVTTLYETVEAQREYRAIGRDGNPPAYAQQFLSSEGRQDGLFWPTDEGESDSPLGELLAEAEAYSQSAKAFNGYHYRMLTAQGESAPGGERNYLDEQDLLTSGFAVIAWPTKFGNSGIMTFQVNHLGIVFQKDLGAETESLVAAIQIFDPDMNWDPTGIWLDEEESEELVEEEYEELVDD